MDAALLLPLIERVPSMAAPCRSHVDLWRIGEETAGWARAHGLVVGDPDGSRVGRGRFERLAARVFPETGTVRVVRFAKWLTWLFSFDDTLDDGPLGRSATGIDALYAELLRAVRRGAPRPGAGPLEVTLAELWAETVPGLSSEWRRRFIGHMEWHRSACMDEAVNRRTGRTPSIEEYPLLRRRTAGPFVFDLAEAVLGVEVPEAVASSKPWARLVDGTNDLIAWCNDVASYAQETMRDDPHNYVTVASRGLGLDPIAAVDWVNDRITERAIEVQAAARALPAEFTRKGLDLAAQRGVSKVAVGLLGAPRAHLDWLLECGRYTPVPVPAPRKGPLRIAGRLSQVTRA
ncbi:terpene synthase family protein [Actinocorallia longicatena]|uniref:Terpene synthase n=1 Tax=Actinocorallia longicatena TaxID=111803 RepID=A0ABP6QAF5_9ACTN